MSIYFLKENNEIGPLTTNELQALLDANCINKEQPVRLEDGTESVAGTIDGVRLAKREEDAVETFIEQQLEPKKIDDRRAEHRARIFETLKSEPIGEFYEFQPSLLR